MQHFLTLSPPRVAESSGMSPFHIIGSFWNDCDLQDAPGPIAGHYSAHVARTNKSVAFVTPMRSSLGSQSLWSMGPCSIMCIILRGLQDRREERLGWRPEAWCQALNCSGEPHAHYPVLLHPLRTITARRRTALSSCEGR